MSSIIVSLIVKVTVIFVLGLGLTVALRQATAAFRHVILLGTLVSALLLPILLAVAPRWQVGVLSPSESGISDVSAPTAGSSGPQSEIPVALTSTRRDAELGESGSSAQVRPSIPASLGWFPSLPLVWAFGSLSVLGWLTLGHLRLRRLAERSWPLDSPDWVRSLHQEAEGASGVKRIRLLCHPDVSTPLTWGLLDPVIMFPEEALEWSEEHRLIVLRHELSHVARNDALAQLAAGITCAIYWFHPLVWIAERRLRAECERACDDSVVASGTPAPVYAAHLLEVARSARSFGGSGFLSVAMARPSQLEGRLLAVLDESRPRDSVSRRTRWLMIASMSAVALVVSAFRPVHRTAKVNDSPIATETKFEQGRPDVVTTGAVNTAPALVSQEGDSTFERALDVESGRTLILDLERTGGTVTITSWDRAQVQVSAQLGGRNWRETRVTLEPVAGGVALRDVYTGSSRRTSFSNSFDIRVPRNFDVRLNSAGGGISISGVNGRFIGTTGGGEIRIDRASGEVDLTTGGGEINVTNSSSLKGSVTTGGGAVRIDGSGRELVASSGSGDVTYTNSRTVGGTRSSVDNAGIPRSGGTTTFLKDYPDLVLQFGEGGIQRHRSGGAITIAEAPNGARVTTGGGPISIGPSAGEVYATTGGGSINIGPASGSVIASTGAGDIKLAFRGSGLHAADVSSGLGRVELILPENINAELVLETAYTDNLGHKTRIDSDWPLTITETDQWDASIGTPRKYVRTRRILGTGGGVIRVRTINGNVVVRRDGSR